jgi:DNA-directed RNA polymerase specialized sigma24 family protein
MASGGSVTHWIYQLKDGDPAAAQKLWETYFRRLVGLARKKLLGCRRRAADEEDVALDAFASFCRGAEEGRFPQLADRHGLWRLLVVLTARKAHDLVKHERRLKRGGGKVGGESALGPPGAEGGIEQVVGNEPSPDFAAQVAEEYQRLLAMLDDDELRSIAVWSMEGCTQPEIATRLGRSLATIERRLALIRGTWEEQERP